MSREANQKRWEMAVPLAEAWAIFASHDQRAAFGNAEGFFERFNEVASRESPSGIFKALSVGWQSKIARDALIAEMREHLLDELFNAQLLAVGIRQRPSKSHYPVSIDAEFFDNPDINWDNSTAEWLGKAYSSMRIFDPSIIDAESVRNVRKGSIQAIDRAIAALKLEENDFCYIPRKLACQLVRERLKALNVLQNGLSDQNISKRILCQCPKRGI